MLTGVTADFVRDGAYHYIRDNTDKNGKTSQSSEIYYHLRLRNVGTLAHEFGHAKDFKDNRDTFMLQSRIRHYADKYALPLSILLGTGLYAGGVSIPTSIASGLGAYTLSKFIPKQISVNMERRANKYANKFLDKLDISAEERKAIDRDNKAALNTYKNSRYYSLFRPLFWSMLGAGGLLTANYLHNSR